MCANRPQPWQEGVLRGYWYTGLGSNPNVGRFLCGWQNAFLVAKPVIEDDTEGPTSSCRSVKAATTQ